MDFSFEDLFKRHGWNIILVACFLIGQFYLIEYRMGQAEADAKANKKSLVELIHSNAEAIKANSGRIQTIEIGRASDMSELRTLLSGLQKQINRMERLTEQQYEYIQRLEKPK